MSMSRFAAVRNNTGKVAILSATGETFE
jgi:hypothetical protein